MDSKPPSPITFPTQQPHLDPETLESYKKQLEALKSPPPLTIPAPPHSAFEPKLGSTDEPFEGLTRSDVEDALSTLESRIRNFLSTPPAETSASSAFKAALPSLYPEFLSEQQEGLDKCMSRAGVERFFQSGEARMLYESVLHKR